MSEREQVIRRLEELRETAKGTGDKIEDLKSQIRTLTSESSRVVREHHELFCNLVELDLTERGLTWCTHCACHYRRKTLNT